MANQMYDKGREAFLTAKIDWLADDIIAIACDSGYSPLIATHQFISDIPSGAIVKRSAPLGGKTSTGGIADADDAVFTAVPGSKTIDKIILAKSTGTDATSRLIGKVDQFESGVAVSIPTGAGGGDVIFRWSDGANKILKL